MIEDKELREILRATAEHVDLPTVMPQPMRRKVTLRRTRTIGATLLLATAIAIGGIQGMRAVTNDEAEPIRPANQTDAPAQTVEDLIDRDIRDLIPAAAAPEVPYMIDVTTRDMTPLPDPINNSLAQGRFDRFAMSPAGSSLAFVGEAADDSPQIFIAGIDGTGLRQVTNDPRGAVSPAWSPDGTKIAYEGYGGGDRPRVFVVELDGGRSRQIADDRGQCPGCLTPQFVPDGSSIIYSGGTGTAPVVRIVPVTGGESTLFLGPEGGLSDAGNASLSPDGSLVTFLASGSPVSGEIEHCGPCRFLANADGTDKRVISGWIASPAGTWSPDGTRIVLADDTGPVGIVTLRLREEGQPPTIVVVDVATGETTKVAEGRLAIWLDDHTLLVDV